MARSSIDYGLNRGDSFGLKAQLLSAKKALKKLPVTQDLRTTGSACKILIMCNEH